MAITAGNEEVVGQVFPEPAPHLVALVGEGGVGVVVCFGRAVGADDRRRVLCAMAAGGPDRIVTGATGIAAASARRFATEGARVVVISRTEVTPSRMRMLRSVTMYQRNS